MNTIPINAILLRQKVPRDEADLFLLPLPLACTEYQVFIASRDSRKATNVLTKTTKSCFLSVIYPKFYDPFKVYLNSFSLKIV